MEHCPYQSKKTSFPDQNGAGDPRELLDTGNHSYLLIPFFQYLKSNVLAFIDNNAMSGSMLSEMECSPVVRVIDKVHWHVCGYAAYGETCTRLSKSRIWSDEIQKYLAQVIDRCNHCIENSYPQASKNVAIATLNCSFNDVTCVNHFFLDSLKLLYTMALYNRNSAAHFVDDGKIQTAVLAIESVKLSQFRASESAQGDQAFEHDEIVESL